MDVGRTQVVTSLRTEQIAYRAVDRNRIAARLHATKRDFPFTIGFEGSAQVQVRLLRILVFVKAFRGGVPHVHARTSDRAAIAVPNSRGHEDRHSGSVSSQQ